MMERISPKQEQLTFDWSVAIAPPASAQISGTPPVVEQPMLPHFDAARWRTQTRKPPACLPVPKPLPSAIENGHFGWDEGRPIKPSAAEVRAITENHAERLIALLTEQGGLAAMLANPECCDRAQHSQEKDRLRSTFQSGLADYAEDFGQPAAARLEAYVFVQFNLRQRGGRR